MEYLKTDVKCPKCGEYLFLVSDFHACFECGHEQPKGNPTVALTRSVNSALKAKLNNHE